MKSPARKKSHPAPVTNGRCRVVLTGGPGGGKTTAADLFRREIGERVVIVPEAATLLFAGGFPRPQDPAAQRAVQRAIFHVSAVWRICRLLFFQIDCCSVIAGRSMVVPTGRENQSNSFPNNRPP